VSASDTAGRSTSTTSAELAGGLAAYLGRTVGAEVAVDRLERLPGGASRESWAFDLVQPGGGRERLVLRRDPPGHQLQSSRAEEFRLLRVAEEAGVAVPRVRWCEEDPTVLGAAFFVMDFVAGETIARRLLRDAEYAGARGALPAQLAAVLARIHAIDPADPRLAFLPRPAPGAEPAQEELVRYEQIFRAISPDPHPALELGFRWLGARVPASPGLAVVHGDFRIGNVLFGPEGLRAVLDWELAHVGDPAEDVGWLCVRSWRFGAAPPVGGLCEREPFLRAYAEAGGRRIDPSAVRWWEAFGNLKWAVVCIMQAKTFLDGAVRSVELASLGRRVAEMELELLELMEA
jgi:aminoglycoside phosphotransferase (APT) family kinase protein